jgi:hypothetical protein
MKINRGGRAFVTPRTNTITTHKNSPKQRACPDCKAYPHMPCRVWREEEGVRYIVRTKVTYCAGRRKSGTVVQPEAAS